MALVINHNSLNGKGFLLQLGFTSEVLASLLAQGWDVKLTAKTLTLFKNGGGEHQVPVDLTLLNGVNAGALPFAQKGPLLAALKSAVQAALLDLPSATHGLNPSVSAIQPEQAGGLTFVHTGLGKPKPTQPTAVQPQEPAPTPALVMKGMWPLFDPKKLKQAPLIKLRDATQMYQPVQGTSHGSRYYLVAANDGVRVAAKLHGGTLSVRVEGDDWKKHQAAMLACGFDNHGAGKDYTSLHVAVGSNTVLANKTLGAILTGLGLSFETPIPNVKVIGE